MNPVSCTGSLPLRDYQPYRYGLSLPNSCEGLWWATSAVLDYDAECNGSSMLAAEWLRAVRGYARLC